jgi:GMP synthase (glutamine-hydrolysing)
MDVLALIHGSSVRAGVFGDIVQKRGHRLDEWSLAWGTPLPRPLDAYGAVLVFGGSMHADEDRNHPWLREETMLLERLIDLRQPVLGICLGAQLLARAAHAPVRPARTFEIGWHPVQLTADAQSDPVVGLLPQSFHGFQWHYYEHGVPAGAVELARSPVCTQAFRLGTCAWGVQFHPEVTLETVEEWIGEKEDVPVDWDALRAESEERIAEWNELGRTLCNAFVDVAERVPATA